MCVLCGVSARRADLPENELYKIKTPKDMQHIIK